MIDDSSTTQSFNDEPIVRPSPIILGCHLNNAFLNQKEFVCDVIFLAQELALFVSFALHTKYEFLFGGHAQIFEVAYLVELHFNKLGHFVIVFEYLLFEVI